MPFGSLSLLSCGIIWPIFIQTDKAHLNGNVFMLYNTCAVITFVKEMRCNDCVIQVQPRMQKIAKYCLHVYMSLPGIS